MQDDTVRFPILRFGLLTRDIGPESLSSLRPLEQALGYRLGTTVCCQFVSTDAELMALLVQSQLDAAWVPPVVAMDCKELGVALPILSAVRKGKTVYHAVVYSAAESKIKSLADLRQVRAAWVSRDSASGYLVPLASLRASGVPVTTSFVEKTFLGSHGAVVRAVVDGRADIGASYAHYEGEDTRRLLSASWTEADAISSADSSVGRDPSASVKAKFRVLFTAGPIPNDVIVAHRSTSEWEQQAVVAAFKWLKSKPEADAAARDVFMCEGFVACEPEHLRGLRKLVCLADR